MAQPSSQPREYDVYINYAAEDEAWVNSMLVPSLRKQGFRLAPGDQHPIDNANEVFKIEQQVRSSYRTILVLSPAWLQSKWSTYITALLTNSDPTGYLKRRLWPILLEDCELPPNLQLRHKADCREHTDWNETINRLVYQLRRISIIMSKSASPLPSKPQHSYVDPNALTQLDPNASAAQSDTYPEQFRIGEVVDNRYTIISQLGKGGFAITYVADDAKLKKQCVIKQLIHNPLLSEEDNALILEMLEQEVDILSNLTPSKYNIPNVHDFLKERRYFVMNYINGRNLRQVLEQNGDKPLSVEYALSYIHAICVILEFLHTRPKPILHCDIKLDNIILDYNGEIWLIDFGLGRVLSKIARISERVRASVSGTPGYMAPEQIAGNPEPRSDVYALAVVLFQLLTGGKHPIGKDSTPQTITSFNQKSPEKIAAIQLIFEYATKHLPTERPDARLLRQQLEDLIKLPLLAPDSTQLKNMHSLVSWCEQNWEDESEEHSAITWLYGTLPADLQKVWHKFEENKISGIRKIIGEYSHVRDHDAGLDAALVVIDEQGFGEAKMRLEVVNPVPLRFGQLQPHQTAELKVKVHNPGRRYTIARITRPSWITTPTVTVGLRPGDTKTVTLTAHGARLPQRRRIKDEIEVRYSAYKPLSIRVHAAAEPAWWRVMLPWVLGISIVVMLVTGMGWYWGYLG